MVLRQSPDTPVMSCFHESARLRLCSSRALSRMRTLFHIGAWCSDPGIHVLRFGFRVWVRTLALHFLSLCECAASSSLGTAHSCPRVFCYIARSSCFYRLRAFVISCAVWHAACIFIGQVKSSHLYLYSAFNNTNCNKALHNIKISKFCQ